MPRLLFILLLSLLHNVPAIAACLPLDDEQWTCSAGTIAQPDGFGGWRYSDGSNSKPDGYGGFRHSDGSVSRPDGQGGYKHTKAPGSRMGVFAASRAAAARAEIESSLSRNVDRWSSTSDYQSGSDARFDSESLTNAQQSSNPEIAPKRFDTSIGRDSSSRLSDSASRSAELQTESQSVWSQAQQNLGQAPALETWQSNRGTKCSKTGEGGFSCRE